MKALLALLLGLTIGFISYISFVPAEAACCGGSSYQLNPDIYEVSGYPSPRLQELNPLTQRLKTGANRTIYWRYVVTNGCLDGNMGQTLRQAMADSTFVGATFVEVSSGYDLTITADCGLSFSKKCGGGSVIACLWNSWPYKSDIAAVTTMAGFYDQSQESIWLHELMGHALATWNEQYQLDGNFSASPNLIDFMNTGPNSRYIWPQNDIDRWERTMYRLTVQIPPDCSGPADAFGNVWDPCKGRWVNGANWSFDPSTGIWYGPDNSAQWSACNQDRLRWSLKLQVWMPVNTAFYAPASGYWSVAPPC